MQAKDIILGLLMQGPMSGYDIKQHYEVSLGHFFDASYGSVYPTLKQLEKTALIEKETIIQEGKPNKNLYSITDQGKEQFYQYLFSPIQADIYRSDILARLYFGKFGDAQSLIERLQEAVIQRQAQLAQLEHAYHMHKQDLSAPRLISLQFGMEDYKAQISVFQKGIQYLRSEESFEFWER
ncbi:PadR family transcriptional regulator [Paenibacillus taiwanensis]|uniref:PadR family transcriptional regulator n=1 Tax=Paenibacillus taiwanensis TaxID=401638 RepID=UPI0003FCE401|nr:PadR family transcriptional regulator [Paenibacillus taiwanensis]